MSSVLHLLRSQVHALRWWLLAWTAALAAWTIGRWTYLTEFRETWPAREQAYFIALISFSALLTAALVHLHPAARKTAAWRAWPLRPWKLAAAQLLFVLIFLVLLPGAMEAAFLLHPKLDGFMEKGMRQWFTRSLWPLPIALGLAACSTSLKRFLLDAVVLTGIAVGLLMLPRFRRDILMMTSPYLSVVAAILYLVPAGVVLWLLFIGKRGLPRAGRVVYFLTPPAVYGLGILTQKPVTFERYGPVAHGPAASVELQERIRIRVEPGVKPMMGTAEGIDRRVSQHCLVSAKVDGLDAHETAWVHLEDPVVSQNGLPVVNQFNPLGRRRFYYDGQFGDNQWTPWSQPGSLSLAPFNSDERLNLFHLSEAAWELFPSGPVNYRGTAHLHIREWTCVLRLPPEEGAKASDGQYDAQVLFVGDTQQAEARGIKPRWSHTQISARVVVRQFGERSFLPQARLVHKATGRLCNALQAEDYSRGSLHGAHCHIQRTDFSRTSFDARNPLPADPLTHPDQYEVVVCKLTPAGYFTRELVIDNLTVKP